MTFTLAVILDRALRDAGIPIDGVSLGSVTDRSTWRAFYQDIATPAQRIQGDNLLATLQADDVATNANLKADLATSLADMDLIKAVVQALFECIPAPAKTAAQLRARIVTLLKA
jgi:hypothetical protein